MEIDTALYKKYRAMLPHLNERQQRLFLANEAMWLGYGGIMKVHRASGVSRVTIQHGIQELKEQSAPTKRIRKPGGGRKKAEVHQSTLPAALHTLVDPLTRGDPESPLCWVSKSVEHLTTALQEQGFVLSTSVVRRLLKAAGYSLQAQKKTDEGGSHIDRDAQFSYINETAKKYLAAGAPVISVDTKKKELVGAYKNTGSEYQIKGQPDEVKVYDFVDKKVGKAIPYGVYDLAQNQGWVNVGITADTAAFAVASIRKWWEDIGSVLYPDRTQLLITADSGGSHGRRVRLWKTELQKLADAAGLEITVCHFPPGTSKWNKIEHRLFSHISMNWRGKSLVSYEVIVALIGATTTTKGLRVQAALDEAVYAKKIKITDAALKEVRLLPHAFHGEWNYTIKPSRQE